MLLGGQRLGGGELRVKFLANEELSKHSQKLPEQAGDWPIAQAGQPENPFFKPTGSNPLGHAAASVWHELSTRRRLVRRYKSQMDCALVDEAAESDRVRVRSRDLTGHLSGTAGDGRLCFGDSLNRRCFPSRLAGPNEGCNGAHGMGCVWVSPNIRSDMVYQCYLLQYSTDELATLPSHGTSCSLSLSLSSRRGQPWVLASQVPCCLGRVVAAVRYHLHSARLRGCRTAQHLVHASRRHVCRTGSFFDLLALQIDVHARANASQKPTSAACSSSPPCGNSWGGAPADLVLATPP